MRAPENTPDPAGWRHFQVGQAPVPGYTRSARYGHGDDRETWQAAGDPPPPAAVNPSVPAVPSDLIRGMTALGRQDRIRSMAEVSAAPSRLAVPT